MNYYQRNGQTRKETWRVAKALGIGWVDYYLTEIVLSAGVIAIGFLLFMLGRWTA